MKRPGSRALCEIVSGVTFLGDWCVRNFKFVCLSSTAMAQHEPPSTVENFAMGT